MWVLLPALIQFFSLKIQAKTTLRCGFKRFSCPAAHEEVAGGTKGIYPIKPASFPLLGAIPRPRASGCIAARPGRAATPREQHPQNWGFILFSPLNGNKFLEGIGVSSWLIVSCTPAPHEAKMLEAPMGAGGMGIIFHGVNTKVSGWWEAARPAASGTEGTWLLPKHPDAFQGDLQSFSLHRTSLVLLVIY